MPPPQRPIANLLIANRGEIAIRILQSAACLPHPPTTYAIYTETDSTHVSLGRPDHSIRLSSPSGYMDVAGLIKIVQENKIDAVHPGYGFLSESAEFSRRMWEEAGCVVVGPGWEVLERTGDKLKAKMLAAECKVPVLKAMQAPTGNVAEVQAFASQVGYPLMIKAVDGGGGRGIRLVRNEAELKSNVERCIGESPSRTVFAEQAAVQGFKHIEVQILGDGKGGVKHLWERDCSVQRRYQKIVEVAPAPPVVSRKIVAKVVDAAVKMARKLNYRGLGTWEFLVNSKARQFYFLEINPRLQVEHTISENIAGVDLVKEQLLIAQGLQEENLKLGEWWEAEDAPKMASIQLRLCAEDPSNGFALSIGKVTDINLPSGNGIRVDTHLSRGGVVGSDFDNMMAKIIVTAPTFRDAVVKCRRALAETEVVGVKTNLDLLRAIAADAEFTEGHATTDWLERKMEVLLKSGEALGKQVEMANSSLPTLSLASGSGSGSGMGGTSVMLRKGDAWDVKLQKTEDKTSVSPAAHHLRIDKISRNEFPEALVAEVSYTTPGSKPQAYRMTLNSTTASADAASSSHRRGDPSNKSHIVLPMSGKLIEVLVEEGDEIQENQVIGFVKQMKMELEIRSPRAGRIGWVIELENEEQGDDVAEGVLLAELVPPSSCPEASETQEQLRSRL